MSQGNLTVPYHGDLTMLAHVEDGGSVEVGVTTTVGDDVGALGQNEQR